jgi:hypothetical protein
MNTYIISYKVLLKAENIIYPIPIDNLDLWKPERINWDWIKTKGRLYWMAILDILKLPYTQVSVSGEIPAEKRWEEFIKENTSRLQSKIQGKYFIEIDDKFSKKDMVNDLLKKNNSWHEEL